MANLFNAIPQFGGGGGIAGYGLWVDQKTSGTNGGTFTQGAWRIRTLNTEKANTLTSASLSANKITLGSGTYLFRVIAPARRVLNHQARVYDETNLASYLGSSAYVHSTENVTTSSFVSEKITINSDAVFSVEHQCTSTFAASGFGVACGIDSEIYTILEIIEL